MCTLLAFAKYRICVVTAVLVLVLLITTITAGAAVAKNSTVRGQRCAVGNYRPIAGVCTSFGECAEAISNYRAGLSPTLCSASGKGVPVVCCPTQERISAQKCKEYAKIMNQKHRPFPLLPLAFLTRHSNEDKPKEHELTKCAVKPHALIANGRNAKIDEFPYVVSLGFGERSNNKYLCGGVLISDNFVLTAAHCVDTKFGPPRRALLGTIYLENPGNETRKTLMAINETVIHPGYKAPSKYNDIALLRLAKRIRITKSTLPACLPFAEHLETTKPAQVSGWGLLETGVPATTLQVADLERLGHSACAAHFKDTPGKEIFFPDGIRRTQLCAGHQERDSCQGDSGGPLTAKLEQDRLCMDYVVGLTSFGSVPCGQGDPGVYTKVQSFLDWIENIVWPLE